MLDLIENNFLNEGLCVYEDGWGNKAEFKRKGDMSFSSQITFSNPDIIAETITVNLPFKTEQEKKGSMLQLKFNNGAVETQDVINTIQDYTILIQRWINMLTEISFFDPSKIPDTILSTEEWTKNQPTSSFNREEWLKKQITCLCKYEELKDTIKTIMELTPNSIKNIQVRKRR